MLKYFQTSKRIIPIQNKCYDIVIINSCLSSSLLQNLLFHDNHKKLYIFNLLLVNKKSIHIENIFFERCKNKVIFINSPLIYGYPKYQIIQILKSLNLSLHHFQPKSKHWLFLPRRPIKSKRSVNSPLPHQTLLGGWVCR